MFTYFMSNRRVIHIMNSGLNRNFSAMSSPVGDFSASHVIVASTCPLSDRSTHDVYEDRRASRGVGGL